MKFLPVAFAALMLSACAATGTQFDSFKQPSEGQSMLYVYRPKAFVGGGVHFKVAANDTVIGRLRNGGYLEKELPPGEYDIWAQTEAKRSTLVELKPDETRCVRAGVDMGVWVGRPRLETVSLNECEKGIRNLKQSF
ncbi:Protein of uncharacterised function (DUF2846) [Kingella potus]|uniref:Protein of uncharacterized function (DUF2846) n=1 Tax=Kingella potus TaxID=265175 RepID=A0A377R038_9NEIS|nr:DUF2846 domain-containing protein [Kingella potus]STR00637.1 Protein of uncharacterised function (DUF2846) [Kingella potus]